MASCSHNNPRKFSEKIALHKQKEAEDKLEYDKIMSECAMVKGTAGRIPSSPMSSHNNVHHPPPAYSNNMCSDVNSRLLPPNISCSSNRHGSLPNVNAAIQSMEHPGLHTEGIPLILDQRLQSYQHQHHHPPRHHSVHHANSPHGHHISLREQQPGPIRSVKNRIDTSPYGSSYHLLPPANPVDWRRTVSDSSLHHSVHGAGGSHENLSKTQGPSHLLSSSPHKRSNSEVSMDEETRRLHQMSSPKQSTTNFSEYLLPNDPSDKKPGSLPDLSTFTGVNISNDRSNGGGCSSNENSPPGLSNGSSGQQHPTPHLRYNPSSPDVSTSPWSPNHHSEGGDYNTNPHSSHLYTQTQVSSPMNYGGRCTSPVDAVGGGSPHSPLGHSMSPTSPVPQPNFYSQEQLELSREFQRVNMMDSWDSSTPYSHNYYSRGHHSSRYEPINNEIVNLLTNMDSKGTQQIHQSSGLIQMSSKLPNIILTDVAGTDQDLHGLAMTTALECVNEDSLKADLGKLDDSMLRLLTESAGSDQAIADPVTEEHLKLL
ncbi:CRTC1 [Lepeophtheirus salmonis]|uniref:CRTC1 n=2 Tax=Lepeophtheirus salmonis TaxID=72036 RepID=A0A7R8H7R7_LEPSM|nr:CRTC1 [Lepeophtheirus salmonis]CAF2927710.1 CRTC1 [Lepeophtheirus salmonis]